MILKALYDYYNRDTSRIPYGRKNILISFIIVISKEGEFVRIEDTRNSDGKGKPYWVPSGEHNNGESPLLFYDNVQYLLDYTKETDTTKKVKSHKKHLSFVNRCKDVAEKTQHEELKAVSLFYEKNELNKVYEDKLWEDIKRNPLVWLTFQVQGERSVVSSIPELDKFNVTGQPDQGTCLVTGANGNIVRLCTSTPIAGAKSSAKLVSFNDDSFCSYGKEQGGNATISEEAEFAFSSALKKLTDKNSRNKFSIGTRTYLFWASSNDEASQQAEESLFDLLGFSDSANEDDPNANIIEVRQVFNAIYSGTLKTTLDDKFYILGLAPNSARIAVVYWSETKLKDFAGMILKHFEDMDIKCSVSTKPYYGLFAMLKSVTLKGDMKNCPPNLPDAVAKSIFQGIPYPTTLFSACIRRIGAESSGEYSSVTTVRTAILKAYLNRLNNNNDKKIEVMLDKGNTNQGYLCGRLFAVLDKIQEDANHISSIRERYMNAARATPSSVFSTILNLSSHHSEKLNEGAKIHYEKLKQEIISKISADGFPAHLDLQDQGRFFVGYYHQRQDFFTSKNNGDANTENNE